MILDKVKEEFVKDLVKKGKRPDGRQFMEYRPIKIETGIIPNAEGSALAEIGDTKVLCGVKIDVLAPFADRPEEGVVMVNAEFSPIAHPDFEPGPPNEYSIELARVVDRAIRSAESVDTKKLFLEEGKVMGVFLDVYVLDHDGNLIDCAALAAMAALLHTRVPKYADGKIIRTEFAGPLEIRRKAVSVSFENIEGVFLADATNEEEVASSGRLSLGVSDDGFFCSGQKSGKAGLMKEQMVELMEKAAEQAKFLFQQL